MVVKRTTLFKLSDDAIPQVLAAYETVKADSAKDGKPYIISLEAAKLYDDPRSQGFTFAAYAEFASLEDMKFYDDADEAHAALKKIVGPLQTGVMAIYWDA